MEQLTLDEILFPIEESKWDLYGDILDKWIADKDSDYKMVYQIIRGSWIRQTIHYGLDSAKRDIADIVKTKCYHGNVGDNYIWSVQTEDTILEYEDRKEVLKNYYIFFKMNDKIIVRHNHNQFKGISFPASEIDYFNSEGEPINFTFRNEFIEQGLGLMYHGKIRSEIFKDERSFSTLETDIVDILNYWEKGE
jgi:hypothetical protein